MITVTMSLQAAVGFTLCCTLLVLFYQYEKRTFYISNITQYGFSVREYGNSVDQRSDYGKKKRLYFCHVAKTGGTTLENIIVKFALDNRLHIALFDGLF